MSATAVRPIAISCVALLGLCLGGARHAESQTRSSQIGPAIFGGTGTRADKPGGLDLSAQWFGSYDDDVLADQRRSAIDQPRSAEASGLYTGLSLGLQYYHVGRNTNFTAHTSNSLNYYPDLDDLTTTYHQVGGTVSHRFGRRYTIHASPFASYSPSYSMRLFLAPLPVDPGGAGSPDSPPLAAPDVDSTILQRANVRYGGNAELRTVVSRYSTLSVGYRYTKTDLSTELGDRLSDLPTDLPDLPTDVPDDRLSNRRGDFDVQSIGATFSHRLSESGSLRFGYELQQSTFEGSTTPVSRTHNLNIGVDYRKPLSRSRRTYLRFSTGSVITDENDGSIIPEEPPTGAASSEEVEGRRIRATGSASIVHQMGRTWSAQAQYRREVGYLEGLARPVFSDSANASLSGLLTRRTDLFLNVNYITGTSGLSGRGPRFDSFSATARVRRALSRSLAAYCEYLFYQYDFTQVVDRPAGLPQEFSRSGVRVGLNLWLPLTK
jgi:hypothetical protein